MGKKFTWNIEKNRWLASQPDRAACFEDIVAAIETGGLLDDIEHPNQELRSHQRMFIVLIDIYVYCVPCVEDMDNIFLKNIYPSKKFKAIYLTEKDHGE